MIVEKRTLIGAGSVILHGINVGHNYVLGARACVVRNVAPGQPLQVFPLLSFPFKQFLTALKSMSGLHTRQFAKGVTPRHFEKVACTQASLGARLDNKMT